MFCRSDKATTASAHGGGKVKRKQSPLAAVPPPPTHIPMTLEGAMLSTSVAAAPAADDPLKRSNRTRNRKVNYAALNAGLTPDADTDLASESEAEPPTTASHARPEPRRPASTATHFSHTRTSIDDFPSPVDNGGHLGNAKYTFIEEAEIRRLKIKMKRRGLNEAEKSKMKQLKTSLAQKVNAFRKKLDKLRKNNEQPGALATNNRFLVRKALNDTSASFPNDSTAYAESNGGLGGFPDEPLVVKTKANSKSVELMHPTFAQLQTSSAPSLPVKTDSKSHYVTTTAASAGMATQSAAVRPALKPPSSKRRTVLPVLHRSTQRSRAQHGKVYVHLHSSRDAHCVECGTCGEMLSVRAFVKHLHHSKNQSDLMTVTVANKLELDSEGDGSADLVQAWHAFTLKREQFEEGRAHSGSVGRRRGSSISDAHRKVMSTVDTSLLQQTSPKVVITPLRVSTELAASTATPTTPNTPAVRHSSRARKRKQLHPMESYVYTSPTGETDSKRRRSGSSGDV